MTYEFFNTSNLAFGIKLTSAFTSLNSLADAAKNNINQVFLDLEIFKDYMNRNYLVPRPNGAGSPVRTTEIFDFLDSVPIFIQQLEYSAGKVKVKLLLYNKDTDRMTIASGSTSTKSGYCYTQYAISNNSPNRTLSFTSKKDNSKGALLFRYRVDSSGTINLIGDVSNLSLVPLDINQYNSLSKSSNIANNNSYTSSDYECVCVVGKRNDILVKVNGNVMLKGQGHNMVRCCILYLKPKDVVSGTYNNIFRINYNH